MGIIIDGKAIASNIKKDIFERTNNLKNEKGITPKLSVILIGNDQASQTYVRNKEKACQERVNLDPEILFNRAKQGP